MIVNYVTVADNSIILELRTKSMSVVQSIYQKVKKFMLVVPIF